MTDDLRTMIDERLGDQYVVQRELGRGGMAVVYLARERLGWTAWWRSKCPRLYALGIVGW